MAQLNLNLTPEFERDLAAYMKARGIATKSEAIRTAVKEGLLRKQPEKMKPDWSRFVGSVKQTVRNPKFKTDDDLW